MATPINLAAVDANFREIGDTTAAVYEAELKRLGSPFAAKAAEIHAAAVPMSALFLAQWYLENKYSTTASEIKVADNNLVGARPWTDDPRRTSAKPVIRWDTRQPVGEMVLPDHYAGAILSKTGQYHARFNSVVDAVNEWKYRLTNPVYKRGVYAKAMTLLEMLSIYAPKSDGNDPANYRDVVVTMLKRYDQMGGDWSSQPPAGDGTGGDTGGPIMAAKPYSTVIPGIPGGPVPTIAPVKIKLIPEWRTNNRPGIIARTPRRSVQHGNGNPNSSAAAEANYLYGGAGGRQASYHSSTDDKETWVMVPGNEVTWQAADGSGPGNMNGFSNEMVEDSALWANPARRMTCIRNTADFMGTIAARLDIAKPEQHWTFNFNSSDRHDCPNKLRYVRIDGRLAWDIYADLWYAAKAAERARMTGGDVPTTPTPSEPLAIGIGDTVQTQVALNLRDAAGLSGTVVTTLAVGTELVVKAGPTAADGYDWYAVDGGFVAAAGTDGTPYLTVTKVAPKPVDYAPVLPITELLETNLDYNDTAPAVRTVNETKFRFVADLIEFTQETVAMQYAPGGPAVKAPYGKGDRAIAAWQVEAADGADYYVLAGAGDEWVRVPVANTKRISDAPLLGDEREHEPAQAAD